MKIVRKLADFITEKKILLLTIIILFAVMLGIWSLAPFDRASGDDYGYGALTRAAWMSTGSLIEVIKAMAVTVKNYYGGWQGTWFDIALFSLQPEVFSDNAYFVVPLIMSLIWLLGTLLLFNKILGKKAGFSKAGLIIQGGLFFIVTAEYIPGSKAALYWWNGCAHYMIPYCMAIVNLCLCIRYLFADSESGKEGKKSILLWISILSTLLGGACYQAALFNLMIILGLCVYSLLIKRKTADKTLDSDGDKALRISGRYGREVLCIIPFMLEMTGLVISALSPGNKIRGGSEFGFSLGNIIKTIIDCFCHVGREGAGYIRKAPLMLIVFLILFLLCWEHFSRKPINIAFKGLIALFLLCLSAAMFAPEIYAGVEVSTGTYNFDFQVFWLFVYGEGIILSNILGRKYPIKHEAVLIASFVAVLLIIPFRSNLKDSLSYKIYVYISSGQAEDYKEQMELQTLLLEGSEREVILPMINDEQGPLMHMPVTEDPLAWTNTVTAKFYQKDRVTGVSREVWSEK